MASVDAGCLIGMTIGLPKLDLEDAFRALHEAGFTAVEVFWGQLGPGLVEVPLSTAYATAVARAAKVADLKVSTLNCITGSLDAYGDASSRHKTAETIAQQLRLAAAMEADRILLWDGELDDPEKLVDAPKQLADCLAQALATSELADPPQIAIELHPNTFAFRHRLHEQVAKQLRAIGAGVCLDFCHAGVAFGPGFMDEFSPQFLDTVTHLHYADTDGLSEQLHFPPGEGVLNLEMVVARLAGRGLPMAWDLFGWPNPRFTFAKAMAKYREAVAKLERPLSGGMHS